jgi:hypothetical protein
MHWWWCVWHRVVIVMVAPIRMTALLMCRVSVLLVPCVVRVNCWLRTVSLRAVRSCAAAFPNGVRAGVRHFGSSKQVEHFLPARNSEIVGQTFNLDFDSVAASSNLLCNSLLSDAASPQSLLAKCRSLVRRAQWSVAGRHCRWSCGDEMSARALGRLRVVW